MSSHFPGGDYLYFRIYGSVIALDQWLIQAYRTMRNGPVFRELVTRDFYTRYMDNGYHLRIRILTGDPEQSGRLLAIVHRSVQPWRDSHRIWKLELGTYQPELLRYGASRIGLVEEFFCIDSVFWIDVLHGLNHAGGEQLVWQAGMLNVLSIMEAFELSLSELLIMLKKMRDAMLRELKVSPEFHRDVDLKYRKLTSLIDQVCVSGDKWFPFLPAINQRRSNFLIPVLEALKATYLDRASLLDSQLIPSLIHMSLNRAFRSKHQIQELLVYDYLSRWTESKNHTSF